MSDLYVLGVIAALYLGHRMKQIVAAIEQSALERQTQHKQLCELLTERLQPPAVLAYDHFDGVAALLRGE